MIKLTRSNPPEKLTTDFVKEKTLEYKANGKSVWNIEWLKDSLSNLSHGKCAYCECYVKNESNYLEVEHYEDKKHNPDKVLQWDNLLPSCKHCNCHKSTHDVVQEPIVNPFRDEPHDHLYFHLYRYKAKDDIGQKTIDVLSLNDDERNSVENRFKIGNELEKSLDAAKEKYDAYTKNQTVSNRNKFISCLHDILYECLPESEYSALSATVLHTSKIYMQLKRDIKNTELWSNEISQMDEISKDLCLFPPE